MHRQLKVLCIADMNVYAKARARTRAVAVAEYAKGGVRPDPGRGMAPQLGGRGGGPLIKPSPPLSPKWPVDAVGQMFSPLPETRWEQIQDMRFHGRP